MRSKRVEYACCKGGMVSPLGLLGKNVSITVAMFSRCFLQGVHCACCPPSGPYRVAQRLIRENQNHVLGALFHTDLLSTVKTYLLLVVPARRASNVLIRKLSGKTFPVLIVASEWRLECRYFRLKHLCDPVELSVACQSFECFLSYQTEFSKAWGIRLCELKANIYLATVDNSFKYLKYSFATF